MKVITSSLLLLLSVSHSESIENYLNAYMLHQKNGDYYCGDVCKQKEKFKAVYDSLKENSTCNDKYMKTERLDFVDIYSNAESSRNAFIQLLGECFVKIKSVNLLPVNKKNEKNWHRLKVQMSYLDEHGVVDGYTFFCFTEKNAWPCN